MDIKDTLSNVNDNVQKEIVYLKQKPFLTNWLVIVIAVVTLAVGVWWITGSYYDWKLAVQEAQFKEQAAKVTEVTAKTSDKLRTDSVDAFYTQLATNQKSLNQLVSQQVQLIKKAQERDASIEAKIVEVSTKDRAVDQVVKDSEQYLGVKPVVTSEGLAYKPEVVQEVIKLKLNNDLLTQKLTDVTNQLTLEQQKVAILTSDLEKSSALIKQSTDVLENYKKLADDYRLAMESYKKAAVKSKWVKVKDASIQVGTIVATAFLTRAIVQ